MKIKRENYRKRPSATLVELLLMLIIISVLASIGVSYYVNIIPKTKAAKARHAIALIAEAEKMYRMDKGVYWPAAAGAVNAAIGTAVTGMNLAAVDNDTDFDYSVTGTGRIRAINPGAIGRCAAGTQIRFETSTGVLTVPACYK